MAGRPRKPSHERKLDGNPGRRPIPKEPPIPRADGSTPEWLPRGDARMFFEQFVPRLRNWVFASQVDEPAIALLGATWGISMQALRKLKREGLIRGGRKNPVAQVWKDNVSLFIQLASRFGMTPADRARLFSNEKPPDEKAIGADTLDGTWQESGTGRPN